MGLHLLKQLLKTNYLHSQTAFIYRLHVNFISPQGQHRIQYKTNKLRNYKEATLHDDDDDLGSGLEKKRFDNIT